MQSLLSYLFTQYICQPSGLVLQLLKGQPVTLTSRMQLTSSDLQTIQFLLSKGYAHYSPAHLQLKLSPKNILFYQRVHKLQAFANQYLSKQFGALLGQFVANQMLPVQISKKQLNVLRQGKGSKDEVDYTRLIYQLKSQQSSGDSVECVVNIQALTQLLQLHLVGQRLQGKKEHLMKGLTYKQNEQPLLSLSLGQMSRVLKQNRPKADFIRQLIQQIKNQRLQDFILQQFRRHDTPQQQISRDILMVFNFIRKYPLISQKQLLSRSLLGTQQLRRCLNLLLAGMLVDYYPDRPSPLYRATSGEQVEEKWLEGVCGAIMNCHGAFEGSKNAQMLVKLECMLIQLDDILIIMGY